MLFHGILLPSKYSNITADATTKDHPHLKPHEDAV